MGALCSTVPKEAVVDADDDEGHGGAVGAPERKAHEPERCSAGNGAETFNPMSEDGDHAAADEEDVRDRLHKVLRSSSSSSGSGTLTRKTLQGHNEEKHQERTANEGRDRSSTVGDDILSAFSFLGARSQSLPEPNLSDVGTGRVVRGWLHRWNETSEGAEVPWVKVWARVCRRKLYLYDAANPEGGQAVAFFELYKARVHDCEGMVTSGFRTRAGKHCFEVSDALARFTNVFSAQSEQEKAAWKRVITEAIRGVNHEDAADGQAGAGESKDESLHSAASGPVEMPYKSGRLKKKPIEGKMGIRSWKTRWFRLEGGELRYYSTADMKPSKLKGTLNLAGCEVREQSSPTLLSVHLPDGKVLDLQAEDEETAIDWLDALRETVTMLGAAPSAKHKRRRIAIADDASAPAAQRHNRNSIATKPAAPKEVELMGGDVVVWQGEPGSLFYVLESGHLEISKSGRVVGSIDESKAFGELALIHDVPRAATIRATSAVSLWVVDRRTFRSIVAGVETSNQEERCQFLRNVEIFQPMDDDIISKIAEALVTVTVEPGEYVVRQGDVGDAFYVVKSGHVVVTKNSESGGSEVDLSQCGAGQVFGEIALLHDEPRQANVKALDRVSLYSLDRVSFSSILGPYTELLSENTGLSILRGVQILQGLQKRELKKVARALTHRQVAAGEVVITQNEEGDNFYMITKGEMMVQVDGAVVATLTAGQYFGEMALLSQEKRSASVSATTDVDLLCLTRHDFNKLLGPLQRIMQREAERRAKSSGLMGFMGRVFHAADDESTRVFTTLSELEVVRTIGKGTFGAVRMVRHRETGERYALKIMSKQVILDMGQRTKIFAEKEALSMVDHPFVVRLYQSHQDRHNLYFLLDLVAGGSFWDLLHDDSSPFPEGPHGGLTRDHAQFYAANVFSALSYLHSLDLAYRDLKPENLVMMDTGFLKLVDLGFSKPLAGAMKSMTLVGTPEYLSPELILSRGHDRAVDLWAFGVFLFELFTRRTPFYHDSQEEMFNRIAHADQFLDDAFPHRMDRHAQSLIKALLHPVPAMRLGMLRDGAQGVWKHPFMKGLSEDTLLQQGRRLRVPYVPTIASSGINDGFFETFDEQAEERASHIALTSRDEFSGF